MYRVHEDKIYGVLNDFDLSYQMSDERPNPGPASSKQRTGTFPFMPIDFLRDKPIIHGYRHDLESFMWVILFHIGQYRDGKSVGESGPYHKWLLVDRATLLNEKIDIRDSINKPEAQPAFRPLLHWIKKMARMFLDANYNRATHDPDIGEFDIMTGGGAVTFENMQQILDQSISD
jgi:hypothetical protein